RRRCHSEHAFARGLDEAAIAAERTALGKECAGDAGQILRPGDDRAAGAAAERARIDQRAARNQRRLRILLAGAVRLAADQRLAAAGIARNTAPRRIVEQPRLAGDLDGAAGRAAIFARGVERAVDSDAPGIAAIEHDLAILEIRGLRLDHAGRIN